MTRMGGGFCDPREPDAVLVAADARDGFVAIEQARRMYSIAF